MADTAARAVLQSLSGDIERVLRERREREAREQLAAPPAAKAIVDKRMALADEMRRQVSIVVAKQREREGRRNAALQPVRHPQPKTQMIGPTPERLAKAGGDDGMIKLVPPISDGGTRPSTRAHRIALPLDNPRYLAALPSTADEIARDLVHIFLLATAGPKVTGSYDGVPSTAGGARSGGVQDHVRQAHAMVEDIAASLGEAVVRDITWFVTGQTVKPDGSAMRLADSGRMMSPWAVNDEKDTAIGWGGLYRSLQVVARFMAQRRAAGWRVPTVAASSDPRHQTLALISTIAGRAVARRERNDAAYEAAVLARFLSRKKRLNWSAPTAEDVKAFKSSVRARQQVRREQAEKDRNRRERAA